MKTINIKAVEIIGNCRANLSLDDAFQIEGMQLKNPNQCNVCFLALGHFPPVISRLQSGSHFFAHVNCPDCLSRLEQENRVVFLLGHADKWELCLAISEYCRLCRQCAGEPKRARHLSELALRHQHLGEFEEATEKMKEALAELKRVLSIDHNHPIPRL